MDVRRSRQLRFPPFRLDRDDACLWRGTKAVRLTPKAFAVLQCLAERHGQLVTKDFLLESVWAGTAVGDAVLKVCVREIRRALGDRVGAPRFVATVHRRGYRFIASVTDSDPRPERDGASESPVGSGRTSGSRYRGPAHLVGRESALDRLQRGIEAAWRGTRQIVFVTGEPGIGKTGVVEAFLERVTVDPRVWIAHGQCVETYGTPEPYLPVLDAFGRLCREGGGDWLVTLLRKQAPTWLARALPARGQAAAGAGAPHDGGDDVRRDGHAVLAGAGGGGIAQRRITMRLVRSVFVALIVLLVAVPAAAAPEGQMTWAIHISLAPTWFDPAETPGIATPFMVLYALHDALVKPMPGNPMAPSLAEAWTASKDGLVY